MIPFGRDRLGMERFNVRKIRNRGLLDCPLRKIVDSKFFGGGNPRTNRARTWFKLECGHELIIEQRYLRRHKFTGFRCEECKTNA